MEQSGDTEFLNGLAALSEIWQRSGSASAWEAVSWFALPELGGPNIVAIWIASKESTLQNPFSRSWRPLRAVGGGGWIPGERGAPVGLS